jgi:hypothetical protein
VNAPFRENLTGTSRRSVWLLEEAKHDHNIDQPARDRGLTSGAAEAFSSGGSVILTMAA